ncbi:hypothetical protein V8F33_004574 [Rhypophila sp. PSN 637]
MGMLWNLSHTEMGKWLTAVLFFLFLAYLPYRNTCVIIALPIISANLLREASLKSLQKKYTSSRESLPSTLSYLMIEIVSRLRQVKFQDRFAKFMCYAKLKWAA